MKINKSVLRSFMLTLAATVSFTAAAQKQLPNVTVQTVKNVEYPVRQCLDEGVPIVLTFWGTTCKPCIMELNAIAESYDDWQEEARFQVVAVSTDDSRSSAKAAAMSVGFDWPFTVLLDPNEDLKRAMNVTMMPTMFILDKQGNVVYTHIGYTPGSEEEILKVVKKLQ